MLIKLLIPRVQQNRTEAITHISKEQKTNSFNCAKRSLVQLSGSKAQRRCVHINSAQTGATYHHRNGAFASHSYSQHLRERQDYIRNERFQMGEVRRILNRCKIIQIYKYLPVYKYNYLYPIPNILQNVLLYLELSVLFIFPIYK